MSNLETQPAPLVKDEHGVIRIADSRVTLDSIIYEFQQGATAEQIQEDFPSLTLRDVYATITYYLQNKASVEEYLSRQEQEAAQIRAEIESHQDSETLRERLSRRRGRSAA